MRAVVLTAYGEVDKLEVRDVPDPKVGPNEIKVRMAGASINPVDFKIRSGGVKVLIKDRFPLVLGSDMSGEVRLV